MEDSLSYLIVSCSIIVDLPDLVFLCCFLKPCKLELFCLRKVMSSRVLVP